MVLAAAMTVPGSGPEKVSWEMEQGLDLRGRWEGTWETREWQRKVVFSGGKLKMYSNVETESDCVFTDAGSAAVVMELDGLTYRGTYRIEGDKIVFRVRFTPRRTVLAKSRRIILTLHRVKSGK
jgi:hypothetical protein